VRPAVYDQGFELGVVHLQPGTEQGP
jgi:hypothetical protein